MTVPEFQAPVGTHVSNFLSSHLPGFSVHISLLRPEDAGNQPQVSQNMLGRPDRSGPFKVVPRDPPVFSLQVNPKLPLSPELGAGRECSKNGSAVYGVCPSDLLASVLPVPSGALHPTLLLPGLSSPASPSPAAPLGTRSCLFPCAERRVCPWAPSMGLPCFFLGPLPSQLKSHLRGSFPMLIIGLISTFLICTYPLPSTSYRVWNPGPALLTSAPAKLRSKSHVF